MSVILITDYMINKYHSLNFLESAKDQTRMISRTLAPLNGNVMNNQIQSPWFAQNGHLLFPYAN